MSVAVRFRPGSLGRPWEKPWPTARPPARFLSWATVAVPAGALLGLLLAAVVQFVYVCLGPNFHTVVPGCCYRSAQPSAAQIEALVQRHGIRTVFNLRGFNPGKDWYEEESQATRRLGIERVDLHMCGCYPPPEWELRKLVAGLEQATLPILLHCHSGSDRSALASAVFLLLRTGTGLEQARQQLHLIYGHNPWGMGSCQRRLLDHYEVWLEQQNLTHAPEHFSSWARNRYRSSEILAERQ